MSAGGQPPADTPDPLAHADQPESAGSARVARGQPCRSSGTGVGDRDGQILRPVVQLDFHRGLPGMLADICQRFLHNAIRHQVNGGGQRDRNTANDRVDGEANPAESRQQIIDPIHPGRGFGRRVRCRFARFA